MRLSLVALVIGLTASPATAVTVDWVTVSDPGNACDPQGTDGCFGAVGTTYRIGKYEVSNAQYTEFLNAKASSDPLGLYNPSMADVVGGGIVRSGSTGSFTYSAIPGQEDKPVIGVSWYDSIRFANWLHNGQGGGDTETGSYTLLGGTPTPSNGPSITRNAGATIVLPSEDEWYKAAYYDAVATSYNPYPFADGFNGAACEVPPGGTAHSANCNLVVANITSDVGAYPGSPSAYGTFDQGGNVGEWNEAIIRSSNRGLRGGSAGTGAAALAASHRVDTGIPTLEGFGIGFRVAIVPEPSTSLLLMTGVLGMASWRRSSALPSSPRRSQAWKSATAQG